MMISRRMIYIFVILIYENLIITCSSFTINERRSTRNLCKDTRIPKQTKIYLQLTLTELDRCINKYQTRLFVDHSSATLFEVGDTVKVIDDVMKSGRNLNGMTGEVIFTWEKCDVDPTCCCAEWVDEGLSVHVKFEENNEGGESLFANDTFIHYFAESELIRKKD